MELKAAASDEGVLRLYLGQVDIRKAIFEYVERHGYKTREKEDGDALVTYTIVGKDWQPEWAGASVAVKGAKEAVKTEGTGYYDSTLRPIHDGDTLLVFDRDDKEICQRVTFERREDIGELFRKYDVVVVVGENRSKDGE